MSEANYDLGFAIDAAKRNKIAGPQIREVMRRADEFAARNSAGSNMTLTACGLIPEARNIIESSLNQRWLDNYTNVGTRYDEIVIGSGPHSAIYCAARVARGFKRPLVLERSEFAGGTFALTRNPSWYLNSPNRPGLIGTPGKGEALNYLPGCPVQPADISGLEYQPNTDIAYATRIALAKYANVCTRANVSSFDLETGSAGPEVTVTGQYGDSKTLYAKRIILATGLSDEYDPYPESGSRIITVSKFLKRFDNPWPLRDLRRVAVIGDGDSGKIVIEALTGIGPTSMSLASLDYVASIDWYGTNIPRDCESWRRNERTRYSRIGKLLGTRVNVIPRRGYATPSIGSALVNDRSYDLVILATGFNRSSLDNLYSFSSYRGESGEGTVLGKSYRYGSQAYVIGPAANLGFSDAEYDDGIANRPANSVALFRYANRTAALGMMLPRAI